MTTINDLPSETICQILAQVDNLAPFSQTTRHMYAISQLDAVWQKRFKEDFSGARIPTKITRQSYHLFLHERLRAQALEMMRLFMLLHNSHKYNQHVYDLPIGHIYVLAGGPEYSSSFFKDLHSICQDDFDSLRKLFMQIIQLSSTPLVDLTTAYQLFRAREIQLDAINERIFSHLIASALKTIQEQANNPQPRGLRRRGNGQWVDIPFSKKLSATGLITRLTQRSADQLFDQIPDLEELELGFNGLTSLPNLSLLKSLKILSLQYNLLQDLPDELPALKQLNLTSNRFNHIPEVIWRTTSLKGLAIDNFAPRMCICCDRLGKRASGNTIPELSTKIQALQKLKWLNISSVGLKCLPKELAALPKLESVYALHNNIWQLPMELADKADAIRLYGNPILYHPLQTPSYHLSLQMITINAEDYLEEALPNLNTLSRIVEQPLLSLERHRISIIAIAIIFSSISLKGARHIHIELILLAFLILYLSNRFFKIVPSHTRYSGSFSGSEAQKIAFT